MRSLVVYYSLTGKTRLTARAIAKTLDATLLEIAETKPRKPGFAVYLTGGFAAFMNRRSRIRPAELDLRNHDRVFIGSPVWASRPAPAVNSLIHGTDFGGRDVIPFFTMGGTDAGKALANTVAKIERSNGRVAGSLAICTNRLSDDDIMARTTEAVKHYAA